MAKRGRPRKLENEGEVKYGLCRTTEAEEKNGVIMRTPTAANNYKFKSKEGIIYSIEDCITKTSGSFPMGIILKECSYFDCQVADSLIAMVKLNPPLVGKAIGEHMANLFESEMVDYFKPSPPKIDSDIAFHLYMPINMRYYGNNLSVINQIITDIHYCFFRKHPACYIFRAPAVSFDPLYYLEIYVSNFSSANHSYISSCLSHGIDKMTSDARYIMNMTANHYTANGKRPYHVNPFSTEPQSLTPRADIQYKPDGVSYFNWYNNLYGKDPDWKPNKIKPLIKP